MSMLKRLFCIVLCLILLCAFMFGCKSNNKDDSSVAAADEFPVTVGGVQLNAMPERVVVLSDNLADVVLALGYEITLKGKSAECTQSELSVLPDVSLNNLDGLKELNPDLILVDSEPENADDLAIEGFPIMVIKPAQNRSDFERLYTEVGTALKGKNTGSAFASKRAQDILSSIDDINRSVPSSSIITTACYLFDLDGNAATANTLSGMLLSTAGVSNAFEGNQNGDVTPATLKIADPDYIFCAIGLKEQIVSSEEYSDLSAVQSGKVYEMDPIYMTRQGRTVLQAVNFIHGIVYEELSENASDSPASSSEPNSSASTPSDKTYTELYYGDISEEVKKMQTRLAELGYLFTEPTSEFGDLTKQALIDFQLLNNIIATGEANPVTLETLYSDSAIPRS